MRMLMVLLAVCWTGMVMAADNAANQQRWLDLLEASGVSTVLAQTDLLINQEIANLEKTPLGFTPQELEQLRQQMLDQLGTSQLQAAMISQLAIGLSSQQEQVLQSLFNSPRTRFLQTLQDQLDDAAVREGMRSYKVQVRENAPNSHRLGLVEQLDESLQQTALETELKVELRKQLLALVSKMKTSEIFSEAMLDKQLTEYRHEVESKISRNATVAYLYLFKRTPSPQVEAIIAGYHQPEYTQFMAVCQTTLQDAFREARLQLKQAPRLAKQ